MDHSFLMETLKAFGFGENFMKWISIILKNQESCVMNGGISTGYFNLLRGARQGDPISAYLFVIVLEIFFIMIRKNPNIKGLNILNFEYKLTAFADDTTFSAQTSFQQCFTMLFYTLSECIAEAPGACAVCSILCRTRQPTCTHMYIYMHVYIQMDKYICPA